MAEGGIYDHLGGGFARYSVDAKWLVPHFEKMLYDQAQLLGIYAAAAAMGEPAAGAGATGAGAAGAAAARQDAREEPAAGAGGGGAGLAARAREVIEETVAFLGRELSDPGGGLWSSLDADSEGEEGKFYVWTPDELRAALGRSGAMLLGHAYGVTDGGNFEHGASVVSRVTPRTSPAEEEHLAELRQKLLAARSGRVRPGTDDKVLAGWNGLAISGLCAAWRATGHAPALALALRVAGFLRDRMIRGEAIARVFHEGATKDLDGTLDDYAFCGVAFLELAEATGIARGGSWARACSARCARSSWPRRTAWSCSTWRRRAMRCWCTGRSRTTTARSHRARRPRWRGSCGSAWWRATRRRSGSRSGTWCSGSPARRA